MQIVVLLIVLFNRENEEMFLQVKYYCFLSLTFTIHSTHENTVTYHSWAKMAITCICYFLMHSFFSLYLLFFFPSATSFPTIFLLYLFYSFFLKSSLTFSFAQSSYSYCLSLHDTVGLGFPRYGTKKCFTSKEELMKFRFCLFFLNVHVIK